jgi:hypothetical protein
MFAKGHPTSHNFLKIINLINTIESTFDVDVHHDLIKV